MMEEERAAEALCNLVHLEKRKIFDVLFLTFTEENWPMKNEDN
jgi:hypothetical protein